MKGPCILLLLFLLTGMLITGCLVSAESAQAWYNKGNSLADLGRYEEAIEAYDQALKIDSEYVKAWYNKGSALAILERDEEAIEAYDQALKIDPKKVDAWYNKGNSLYTLGRYEETIGVYDQVLKIDPEYVNAWTNMGNSLAVLGRQVEAIEAYDQALKIDPGNTYAQEGKDSDLNNMNHSEESAEVSSPALKGETGESGGSSSVPYDTLVNDSTLYTGKEYSITGIIAQEFDLSAEVKSKGWGTEGQGVMLAGSVENSNDDLTELFSLYFVDRPLGKKVSVGDEVTVTVQGAGVLTYKRDDGEKSTIPRAIVKSGKYN